MNLRLVLGRIVVPHEILAASGLDPEARPVVIERATLRFAAYQRKWMRRIPGIVMIDADRPVGEVADAILEVARTR